LTRTERCVLSGTLPGKCIILIIIAVLDTEKTCRECYSKGLFNFLESGTKRHPLPCLSYRILSLCFIWNHIWAHEFL